MGAHLGQLPGQSTWALAEDAAITKSVNAKSAENDLSFPGIDFSPGTRLHELFFRLVLAYE
jgi:hypothetical protein